MPSRDYDDDPWGLEVLGDLESVTIQVYTSYTDTDGIEKMKWNDGATGIKMDIQPLSLQSAAAMTVVPPAIREKLTHKATGQNHADLKTGNRVKLANGDIYIIETVEEWTSHTTLTLSRAR